MKINAWNRIIATNQLKEISWFDSQVLSHIFKVGPDAITVTILRLYNNNIIGPESGSTAQAGAN